MRLSGTLSLCLAGCLFVAPGCGQIEGEPGDSALDSRDGGTPPGTGGGTPPGTGGGRGADDFTTPCTEVPSSDTAGGAEGGAGGAPAMEETGWVWCEEGYYHRAAAVTCLSRLPRAQDIFVVDNADNECVNDSDCPGPHAFCDDYDVENPPGTRCHNGCRDDSDCPGQQVCHCGETIGRCVPTADCVTDADCAPGTLCVETSELFGGSAYSFKSTLRCHRPEDECLTRRDCGAVEQCSVEQDGRVCREYHYYY